MNRFYDPENLHEIAWVKRALEYETLIPGYMEELQKDPEGTLKKWGLPMAIRDYSFGPSTLEKNNIKMNATYSDSAAEKYAEFMDNKCIYRDEIREKCTPKNEAMKKWRQRQIGRCSIQLGAKFNALVHAPVIFELQDGCSVGCKFCGLNAGKLKAVFEYTKENAKLFKEVITIVKDIIGDAAGYGTLYYATEPLDNPDYEKFMKDYREVFGITPQITTAKSAGNIERLRPLLAEINENQDVIYRFSLLSEGAARKIFEEFTPEELILTELLPQYEEAPASNLISAGRNAKNDEYSDTISCVSGFVINMVNKTIRLTTPTWASKEHPTGEIILETVQFADGDDFRAKMMEIIGRHMKNIIEPDDEITLEEGITLKFVNGEAVFSTEKMVEIRFPAAEGDSFIKKVFDALQKGYRKKRDIVRELSVTGNGGVIRPELIYYILNRFWTFGLIKTRSGKI